MVDRLNPGRSLLLVAALGLLMPGAWAAAAEPKLSFNRDVRPILTNHCFACHGPDEKRREAGMRLDFRDAATKAAESGATPIVPGETAKSEIVRRIHSADADLVMPPPTAGKDLTAAQKQVLERWIAEGAQYEPHWAYVPPRRPEPPQVADPSWVRNPIDLFVLARLHQAGLSPSRQAEPATLLRRLSLDLRGLPPAPDEVADFVREITAAEPTQADAVYARWVDRLLASPHYGERMAVDWLDAARYADSNGYQVDRDREMYAWRDWVIQSFNRNQPFDQFTVEQLAGDLLPGTTLDQKIATGLHRNHMLNEEGGVIPAEFLAEYCADRVETTAAIWLGQTFNCCRCHDHKFDPFPQRDFYGLFAFFHNVSEQGLGNYGASIRRNAPPVLKLPHPELDAKLSALQAELAASKQQLAAADARLAAEQSAWEDKLRQSPAVWESARPRGAKFGEHAAAIAESGAVSFPAVDAGDQIVQIEFASPSTGWTAVRLELTLVDPATDVKASLEIGKLTIRETVGERLGEPLTLRPAEVEGTLASSETAKALDASDKTRATLLPASGASAAIALELENPIGESKSLRIEFSVRSKEKLPSWELRIAGTRAEVSLLVPPAILAVARKDAAQRSAEEQKQLAEFRQSKDAARRGLALRVASLTKEVDETDLKIPTTLVMEELPQPRKTNLLMRGAYDKPGAEVVAATPGVLPPLADGWPRNRLGLARWLVDPANPLPARVTVNRFWQSIFGVGLVRTAEDFGSQGELPSHPELLDWLATEFIRTSWDVKAMQRLIVTSSTYRQDSRLTAASRSVDPENRLLARGPRFRLQAEFIRDHALAASGLMVSRMGGPSVRPYHPPGLYEQVVAGSGASTYVVGTGDELRRRSLYTYWKRSVPHPAMLVFDAPFREACTLRRPRTNTPLQALNLMNDPTYVEASRLLAERMFAASDTPADQVSQGFRLVLAREPQAAELAVLTAALARWLKEFEADPAGAAALVKVGTVPADASIPVARLAALTSVASTILNLDEAVTKE